jgi:hypothetical protein
VDFRKRGLIRDQLLYFPPTCPASGSLWSPSVYQLCSAGCQFLLTPTLNAIYSCTDWFSNTQTAYTFRLRDRSREEAVTRIASDLIAILQAHAGKPAWIKVDGRPLVVLYIVENYTVDEWRQIKTAVQDAGFDAFLLGDTYNLEYLGVMDGLHIYNPIRFTLRGQNIAQVFAETAAAVHDKGGLFAATVCPGFDNMQLHPLGKRAVVPRENGYYYRMT